MGQSPRPCGAVSAAASQPRRVLLTARPGCWSLPEGRPGRARVCWMRWMSSSLVWMIGLSTVFDILRAAATAPPQPDTRFSSWNLRAGLARERQRRRGARAPARHGGIGALPQRLPQANVLWCGCAAAAAGASSRFVVRWGWFGGRASERAGRLSERLTERQIGAHDDRGSGRHCAERRARRGAKRVCVGDGLRCPRSPRTAPALTG